MIYIVSGYMRSGTSMMMQALEAGGMDIVYSANRDKEMNKKWGDSDYLPNSSYCELDAEDYKRLPVTIQEYNDRVIKCLWGGALKLPTIKDNRYRVIMMRRRKEAIFKSLIAFFGNTAEHVNQDTFDDMLDNITNVLRDRRSVLSVTEIWYDDLLKDPIGVFENLKKTGWPIDSDKAASIPDERKNRFSSGQAIIPRNTHSIAAR